MLLLMADLHVSGHMYEAEEEERGSFATTASPQRN